MSVPDLPNQNLHFHKISQVTCMHVAVREAGSLNMGRGVLGNAGEVWEQTGEGGAHPGKEPGEMMDGWRGRGERGRDSFNMYFINYIYMYKFSLPSGGEVVDILRRGAGPSSLSVTWKVSGS